MRTAAVRLNTVALPFDPMPRRRRRLRFLRIKNVDGVALAVATAGLLFAGELTNAVLRTLIAKYVGDQPNPVLAAGALVLVFFAFTSAFGSFLALVAGALFAQNEVSRGRFFLSLGIGLSVLGLLSKIALSILSTDPTFLAWYGQTLTGLGLLVGIATQIAMSHHAMALKKRWRKLRKQRQRQATAEKKPGDRRSPLLPDQ